MEKSKVYFTNKLTPESLVNIHKHLGIDLKGNVAVKLHSGEDGNQNYVKPEFLKEKLDLDKTKHLVIKSDKIILEE